MNSPALQPFWFEVVAHRLEHEYGGKARIGPCRLSIARRVTCDTGQGANADERGLQRFIDNNSHRMAKFQALREHAGLVFQKRMGD